MSINLRKITHQVLVGNVKVGGGAPIVVQSMTNTDTADVAATVKQIIELAAAGSELVRITVNSEEAASAVAEIKTNYYKSLKRYRLSEIFILTDTSCLKNTLIVRRL